MVIDQIQVKLSLIITIIKLSVGFATSKPSRLPRHKFMAGTEELAVAKYQ